MKGPEVTLTNGRTWEIMRRAFKAFNRGDLDAAGADASPDMEYVTPGALPGPSVGRGQGANSGHFSGCASFIAL